MDKMAEIEKLRYPIGKFIAPDNYSKDNLEQWIQVIQDLPLRLTTEVKKLSEDQLNTAYRDGGWTVRQVVHHLVDSHLNSYCRFKLAITEDTPTIRPYFEERWAELEDAKYAPVELSLSLLTALHARWVYFLKSLSANDLEKIFFHPESKKEFALKTILALYAWHSNHHLHHILELKKTMNWK